MRIQFVDLKKQYENTRVEIGKAIEQVLIRTHYILGEEVERFEKEFASYCDAKYGIGVASGTDALVLSLNVLGIKAGDEVITVPNTFVATVDAILRNRARPIFVDIQEDTYNIAIHKIEEKITKRTRAIMPVHLYGQPADLGSILRIAKRYNLFVIEDACQAHGAEYKRRKVGSFGDLACFSFYPAKNLGACGDGGMIVTDNKELMKKLKMLRNYGQRKKNYHSFPGYNSRLDEIQAAILRAKLKCLNRWIEQRKKIAEKYRNLLNDVKEIVLPKEMKDAKHSYHLFVIRAKSRNKLQKYLASKGIQTGIHYPKPIFLQEGYRFLGYRKGDFPVAEKCAREIISLPMYSGLSEKEISYVCNKIKEFIYDL